MSFIFIDRRKAGKGKSSNNRQKLMNRIRGYIQKAAPTIVGGNAVTATSKATGPVKVAASALEEPFFAYAKNGGTIMVLPGNTEYNRGDIIYIPENGEGDGEGNGAGQGNGNGEDDFIVQVAADEFYDMYFEDCELPNLTEEQVDRKVDLTPAHAGFSTTGNPAQLSIVRTYKQSIGRRRALTNPYLEEIEALELEMKQIYDKIAAIAFEDQHHMESLQYSARLDEIEKRIGELNAKIQHLNSFDKVDLRFRKKEYKPNHCVESVLIMIMDVSGSMDRDKKLTARRWFALLYQFIKRRYGEDGTDVVFIAHTDEAVEMDEVEFFSTRINGGTTASSGIKLAQQIIDERYSSGSTNIYISHASDGDNWEQDEQIVAADLKKIMPSLRYFSYVEVGYTYASETSLWKSYRSVYQTAPAKSISLVNVKEPSECYDVFKEVFRK